MGTFNKIYDSGKIPPNFKDAMIFPLHKKGDSSLVSNYRGISFIDVEAKLFTGLLLNRLTNGFLSIKLFLNSKQGLEKHIQL